MTERHLRLRAPHPTKGASWDPSPKDIARSAPTEASTIETYGSISSGGPEGN